MNGLVADKNGSTTTLVVDSEVLFGQALCHFLPTLGSFNVIGHALTEKDAIKQIDTLHPQIVICSEEGIQSDLTHFIRTFQQRWSEIALVILTRGKTPALFKILTGDMSYAVVSKYETCIELQIALSAVLKKKYFISPSLVADTLTDTSSENPLAPLSPREREIFHALAEGQTNSAIAKRLFISPRTVETHRARVVRKLKIHTNADLIRFAIRNGLSCA